MDRISEKELCALLRTVINAMPSILVYVDRSGRIVFWNDSARKTSEFETYAARDREVSEALPLVKSSNELIRQAIVTGRVQTENRVAGIVGGVVRSYKISVYPHVVDDGSHAKGAFILADVLPDEKSSEKTAREPMVPVPRTGITEQMAHEINNHLAGILQNIQVIKHRLVGDLPKNRSIAEACNTTFEAVRTYVEKRGIVSMIEAILDSGMRASRAVTGEPRVDHPKDPHHHPG